MWSSAFPPFYWVGPSSHMGREKIQNSAKESRLTCRSGTKPLLRHGAPQSWKIGYGAGVHLLTPRWLFLTGYVIAQGLILLPALKNHTKSLADMSSMFLVYMLNCKMSRFASP